MAATSDSIPLEFIFSEVINGVTHGLDNSQCLGYKIAGRLLISFTADIARQLIEFVNNKDEGTTSASTKPIKFRISPAHGFNICHNKRLVSVIRAGPQALENSFEYEFNMANLAEDLAKQVEPVSAYSNLPIQFNVIKYKLRGEDSCSNACPLAASFKMKQAFGSEAPAGRGITAMNLVIRHRGSSVCPTFIKNPTISMTIDDLLTIVAKPPPTSVDESGGHVTWNLPDIAPSSPDNIIDADLRFKGKDSPLPPVANLTFDGEGHLFSPLKLDLVSAESHYRIEQIQKKFKSGHVVIEPEV